MTKTAAKASRLPATYEEAMAELEALIASMEAGELTLEQSLAGYQRGTELVRFCQQTLDRVEQQVKLLELRDGEQTLAPFGDEDGE